jgi:uncharacterized protein
MLLIVCLVLAAFFSSIISGLVGMAGGIALLAVMTFFLPLSTLIPIHGLVQLASNSSRALLLKKHIKKLVFMPFTMGVPIGAFVAFKVLSEIKRPEWIMVLITGLILYVVFKPKKLPYIKLRLKGFFILGIVAGGLGPLIGATGPFLAPFMVRDDFSKEEIVANKAAIQFVIHVVKIPVFLALSFKYSDHTLLIVLMITAVIAGTKIGTILLNKIDGKRFFILIKIAMFIVAIKLGLKLIS